ncbi:MAG: hypothetical protein ACLFUR_00225 [Candidatus Hadarchaeia archaeon]
MTKRYIALNHNYPKSNERLFPVIRKKDVYPEPGEKVTLAFQYVELKAEIILKTKKKAKDIPEEILIHETGSRNREKSMKKLEYSLNNKIEPETKLVVLFLKKLS